MGQTAKKYLIKSFSQICLTVFHRLTTHENVTQTTLAITPRRARRCVESSRRRRWFLTNVASKWRPRSREGQSLEADLEKRRKPTLREVAVVRLKLRTKRKTARRRPSLKGRAGGRLKGHGDTTEKVWNSKRFDVELKLNYFRTFW